MNALTKKVTELKARGFKVASAVPSSYEADAEITLESERSIQVCSDGVFGLSSPLSDANGSIRLEYFETWPKLVAALEIAECGCENSSDRGPIACDIHVARASDVEADESEDDSGECQCYDCKESK